MFNYNKRGVKTGKLHSSSGNSWRVVVIPFLLFGLIGGLMSASGVFGGVYRAEALSGGWSTSGTNIVNPAGGNFTISGINWYGFETKGFVAHGLYAQNYTTIVNSIWFTDIVNLIQSSYSSTTGNYSGYSVSNINWTYWALNTEDSDALLGSGYTGLANSTKEYTFLCAIETGPFAIPVGSGANQCGSTGTLPLPS